MSRSFDRLLAVSLLFLVLLVVPSGPARAEPLEVAAEPSACAAVADGLLVADDELVGSVLFCEEGSPSVGSCRVAKLKHLDGVEPEDPRSTTNPKSRLPKSKLVALQDVEGIAIQGTEVYLIGSHNGDEPEKKKNGEIKKSKRRPDREFLLKTVWKFDADKKTGDLDIEQSQYELFGVLRKAVESHLAQDEGLLAVDPDYSRLNVEGLALCDGELHLGLRSPLDKDGNALILSASPDDWFGDPKKIQPKVLPVKIGQGVGVRSLDCFDGGLVILSGGAKDDSELPSLLWTYRPGKDPEPKLASDPIQSAMKCPSSKTGVAEGVCAIGNGKSAVVGDPGTAGRGYIVVVDFPG